MTQAFDKLFFGNGIDVISGKPFRDSITSDEIVKIAKGESSDSFEVEWFRKWVRQVNEERYSLGVMHNPLKIEEAGWGVIFPEKPNPAVREALSDLLSWRQAQAMSYYKELFYRPEEDRFQFLKRHNVEISATPDPQKMPYYLLIVGDASEIPFTFENTLGYQYAVGRIYFDILDDYARYAHTVVQAERLALSLLRKVSFFSPVHVDDQATQMGATFLIEPLLNRLGEAMPNWSIDWDRGNDAQKKRMIDLVNAPASPALLFFAGHGVLFPESHPNQKNLQGSLLCQEWVRFTENKTNSRETYYSAQDLVDTGNVLGKMVFLLSSNALGSPQSGWNLESGEKQSRRISDKPFVATLPQRLLAHPRGGALAVIGPNDLIWNSTTMVNVFYSSLRYLMSSYPAGYAINPLKNFSAESIDAMNQTLEELKFGRDLPEWFASRWAENENTRSLAIFGDPAVRLPVNPSGEESNQQAIAERLSVELGDIKIGPRQDATPAFIANVVPDLPKALVEAINLGECSVFLGSRLSEQAGYPSREEFAKLLLQWSIYEYDLKDPHYIQEIQRSISGGEANFAIDSLVTRIKENKRQDAFQKFVWKTFQKPEIALPKVYSLLKDLPFSAAITPNLDGLTEKIYLSNLLYTPQDAEILLEVLFKQKFFLLKMRGCLEKPETLVVSYSQFKESVLGNLKFVNFLQSLFLSRMLLFLGAPLDELLSYLDVLSGFTPTRTHYILTPTSESGWQPKAELLQKNFGIQVIPFTETPDQDSLAVFIENLSKAVSRRPKTRKATSGASWLKHVRLENIGPFESLELDFNKSWNILLGDNGVGKSNILRGIAAGMLGQDIQPYADRLIKVGANWGQITLETSNSHVYVTRLEIGSTGVQVSSTGGRPLETEGWLVLGYPPTRTVTWAEVKGQVREFARRPTNEDVLPLIRGDIDPRLDKLKQSFVDLDLRITKGSREEKIRYKRLLDTYQRIIKRVTGKIKLHYAGIENNRVMFDTDDGKVRVEAVSQGTASLMGWIGYLTERLYEVYDKSKDPTREYALVLVDEIDAHMHPEWQRQLTGHLKEIFPKVQFVATTHSPLIPATLSPKEVVRLRRDLENPAQILVEHMEEDMRRWQANQVLTSPLFNLGSTMAPEMEKALEDYTALVWRQDLPKQEQAKLEQAAGLLKVRLPLAMEREEARLAFKLIEATLAEKIKEIPAEKLQSVLDEARVQMLENVTGSRRPI